MHAGIREKGESLYKHVNNWIPDYDIRGLVGMAGQAISQESHFFAFSDFFVN
jgi:hypothetical protein